MGCDAYHPVSRVGSNLTDAGGIGYMILDAIDSLILLGLNEEYQRAREWVANELSFDRDGVYSTFEVSSSSGNEQIVRHSSRLQRLMTIFLDDYSSFGRTTVRI
jgi:hypothetical protein